MSKNVLLRTFSASIVFLACFATENPHAFAEDEAVSGKKAPEFILYSTSGKRVNIRENYRRGPTIINFWATWCQPCMKEMPELQKLHNEFNEKGLSVVAVSIDTGGKSMVRKYLDTYSLSLPVLLDSYRIVAGRFGVEGEIPRTYLIRQGGEIEKVYRGFSAEEFLRLKNDVRMLLNPKGK